MTASNYPINKGINAPIEFRGLKAQYIGYLGGGSVGLLIVFAILYIAGAGAYICVVSVGLAGTWMFLRIYKWSNKYGEHGMMKQIAKRRIPTLLISKNRKLFVPCKKI